MVACSRVRQHHRVENRPLESAKSVGFSFAQLMAGRLNPPAEIVVEAYIRLRRNSADRRGRARGGLIPSSGRSANGAARRPAPRRRSCVVLAKNGPETQTLIAEAALTLGGSIGLYGGK